MDSTARATLPHQVVRNRLLTVAEIAPTQRAAPSYFVRCIRARTDESYRIKHKIPMNTLDRLPLNHWFKRGRDWFIRESDLLAQL